ncbi:putative sugar phosphatase [Trypanosoma rangeli]|uniref:Putative sugar phosphatase n=1 Tax=Trypanosoma rangeli TaxID=5698 RepID=A0A3R7M7Z1_TRYRA|nr:putative sugar phosphatase [Trypanosoma rangeli]RNF10714.1 putative sugar phosphatase [Trypanosoma rangeli]|eukprot:RNF10714.1 putative sugar phosphatase [Trypanosoma rangeli]
MPSSVLPYKVVATDLDGTLLNPDHLVSEYTLRVIEALGERGVPVIFATGRHHSDVLETRRKLRLKGYVITSNGARVHDPQGRVILEKDIEPAIARELALAAANDADVVTSVYRSDSWLMNKHAKDLTEYYQSNRDVFYYQIFDPTTQDYDSVYKVYYTSDRRECLEMLSVKINAAYGDKVSTTFSLTNCLEVMRKGVNKGVTLREVVGMLLGNAPKNTNGDATLTIKDCIAFGDGMNDLEMLCMVEKGCLMKNAQQDLLKMAPPHLERIGANSEDGVARHLASVFCLDLGE